MAGAREARRPGFLRAFRRVGLVAVASVSACLFAASVSALGDAGGALSLAGFGAARANMIEVTGPAYASGSAAELGKALGEASQALEGERTTVGELGDALERMGALLGKVSAEERQAGASLVAKVSAKLGSVSLRGAGVREVASLARGLLAAGKASGKNLDVPKEMLTDVANILVRASGGAAVSPDIAGHILSGMDAVVALGYNQAIATASVVSGGSMLEVAVTDLTGKPLGGLEVKVGASKTLMGGGALGASDLSLDEVSGRKGVYAAKMSKGQGQVADLKVSVSGFPGGIHACPSDLGTVVIMSSDKDAAPVLETATLMLSNRESVVDTRSVTFPKSAGPTLDARPGYLVVVDIKGKHLKALQQAALVFEHAFSKRQIGFTMRSSGDSGLSVSVSLNSTHFDPMEESGSWGLSLVAGSTLAGRGSSVNWDLGTLSISFLGGSVPANGAVHVKPEIRHIFEVQAVRPRAFVSLIFTALTLVPLGVVLPALLLGCVGGVRFFPSGDLAPVRPYALVFHSSLFASLMVLVAFWVSVDLMTTLSILAGIAPIAVFSGYYLLSRISGIREKGK